MREIKFRVFDPNTDEMIVTGVGIGDISYYDFDGDNITEQEGLIIMQYTGLKDKNGVEIYEGDLLEGYDPESRETIRPMIGVYWSNRGMWDCESFILGGMNESCEVVGNIYEQPHL